jgi:periplasmic divalent cation tolerance protein
MIRAAVIYITAANRDEALAIGRTLVSERLVACANVLDGMTSVYRWEGELNEDREAVLIAKTRQELADRVVARVRELHSYDCPCVVSWPITKGNPEYLAWIGQETDVKRDFAV